MNITEIKIFVDNLINESVLKNYPEVFISNYIYHGNLVTDISSKRYDAYITATYDKQLSSRITDHLLQKTLEKPIESFESLDTLKEQWHEFEKLLVDENELPVNYVKYPYMRNWVLKSLEVLADVEYQKRVWINRNYPEDESEYYDLTDVVHALFDDTNLSENPTGAVGYTLRNDEEAEAIGKVTKLIDDLLNKVGNNEPEIVYLKDPDWAHVVAYAKEALKIFKVP